MKIHVLAAGQADATVLELPSGRLAVVDFGHDHLLDYLDGLDPSRARRFAFCLLTHAHHEHYACLEEFIRRHDGRVDEYWFSFATTSGIAALAALKSASTKRVRGERRGRLLVQDGQAVEMRMLEPDVSVAAFAPNTCEVLRPPGDGGSTAENNRSIVLLIRYGRTGAILGADAEAERWTRIRHQAGRSGVSLRVGLVKAPHHGAAALRGMPTELWPELFASPESYAAFSVGRRPSKPALETIVALRAQSRIRCTGRSLTCRPLAGPAVGSAEGLTDLMSLALAPAPEAMPAPPCFGTQVFALDPEGSISATATNQPAFLDACIARA